MKKFLEKMDGLVGFDKASAHCDIPCGIYDPITAQISALTTVRMADLLAEHFEGNHEMTPEFVNRAVRLTATKEEHGEKVKHEIRILWGDFIKQEHLDKYPQINEIVFKIMKLGSEVRQHSEREVGVELLEAVNAFAEIFWEIKGYETVRAAAPYAPNLEIVYRKI